MGDLWKIPRNMQMNLITEGRKRCSLELPISQGPSCHRKKPAWKKDLGFSCSFHPNSLPVLVNPYLHLVDTMQGVGHYCSVRLWSYSLWLPEIRSIKASWQQASVGSLGEPASRTGGKSTVGRLRTLCLSPYSVHAKWIRDIIVLGIINIAILTSSQLLLLFIKLLWKLPALPPVHEYTGCHSKKKKKKKNK